MTKKENTEFIQKTESLVKPEDVTAISFLGDFNKLLSKKNQEKIMKKGSQKIPYMGFIVDPYALFVAYEIKDKEAAQKMLPQDFELADTCIFEGETKRPMVIASAFTARTSAFIGMRLEFYIIARHKKTGSLSWIISEYETNTNSHDPHNGFCGYSCDNALFTTTPYGELHVDISSRVEPREFVIKADLKQGETLPLDPELWIQGNLSVDYGGSLKDDSSETFSLIFDPVLMKEAENIPLEAVDLGNNSYLTQIIDGQKPVTAAYFPYGQHFIIRQDLPQEELKSEEDLSPQIKRFMDLKDFKTMEGDALKKPIFRSMIISTIVNWGIILFLVLKLIL